MEYLTIIIHFYPFVFIRCYSKDKKFPKRRVYPNAWENDWGGSSVQSAVVAGDFDARKEEIVECTTVIDVSFRTQAFKLLMFC